MQYTRLTFLLNENQSIFYQFSLNLGPLSDSRHTFLNLHTI